MCYYTNEISYHYCYEGEIKLDLFEMFSKGGYVMYLLLLSSVAVAGIGIERLNFYNYAGHDGENFLNALNDKFKNNSIDEVAKFCFAEKSSVGAIAFSGVLASTRGENVELALEIAYSELAMKLRARLNYLSMIVTLSPLLGLLGTISGMIESFNIFNLQSGQPLAITGGIGEALIATATGLCVAIFALIVHTYLAQKLDEILTELEKTVNIVLANCDKKGEQHETA